MSDRITRNAVLAALSHHIGKKHGVKADQLVYEIQRQQPDDSDLRQFRDVVIELRMEGCHICARPETGYYMAADAEELNETCMYLYNRAMTSLEQISAMKHIALPDLRGQLKLPT